IRNPVKKAEVLKMTKIAPSILSADFSNLGEEIKDVENGGADYIHVDVMDGHFVPNITIGPLIVEAIKPITTLPLDVHLMIENPDTPVEMIKEILLEVDMVLIMSVNPGFGGQSFIHHTVQKIKQVAKWRQQLNLSFEIEVDGGVNTETAKLCTDAGADVLVAGSAVFNQDNRERAIKDIILATKDRERKSTRLNSSHVSISYAVFCLKKKK